MTIRAAELDAYHHQCAEAGDSAVFPSKRSFVFTSFLLSVLQTGLSSLVFFLLTVATALYVLQLCVNLLWHDGDATLLAPAFLPFAFLFDFLLSFLGLALLSRTPRVANDRWMAKEAYFRLRMLALHRLLSRSSYHRMRYHLWYQQRQLSRLWLLDSAASLLVYVPGALTARALSREAGTQSNAAAFLDAVAVTCCVAFAAAQLTALHRLAQWLLDVGCCAEPRRRSTLSGVLPRPAHAAAADDAVAVAQHYVEFRDEDEGFGQLVPADRVEFEWRPPPHALPAPHAGRMAVESGAISVSALSAAHHSFDERHDSGSLVHSRSREEEKADALDELAEPGASVYGLGLDDEFARRPPMMGSTP